MEDEENTFNAQAARLSETMRALWEARPTTKAAAAALEQFAPILERVWQSMIDNEDYWQARTDGPVYRQTPILGRFRWYRALRVWWLRRQLRG